MKNACPSLFNPTSTKNGILTRIRTPMGRISAAQIEAIANISDKISDSIHITNRANIQIRTSNPLSDSTLKNILKIGLAAQNPDLDHLRNVMISPTAGIDARALLDTRPFAKAWLNHAENHPEFRVLSPKFSIGIDGGESISIHNFSNDISLKATQTHNQIYFALSLANIPTEVLIKPENVIETIAALTKIYYQYTVEYADKDINKSAEKNKPPRLRDLINDWGMMAYFEQVNSNLLSFIIPENSDQIKNSQIYNANFIEAKEYAHIGVHPQKQPGYVYIGLVVPLGRLESSQLRGLADIAKSHGNGNLRLTPYQNVIISDIPKSKTSAIKEMITTLGLSTDINHPYAGLVACTGNTGCKSAMTDTQADAAAIARHLEKSIDFPVNIHLTGCEKSCAQNHPSDITLLGRDVDSYQVFIGNQELKFGKEFNKELKTYPKSELPNLISELIHTYQSQRESVNQSFREFIISRRSCHD